MSTLRCRSTKDAEQAVSVVSFISSSGGYIEGKHLPNDGLLMENTSSIYLYVKSKDLAFFYICSLRDSVEIQSRTNIKTNRLEVIYFAMSK